MARSYVDDASWRGGFGPAVTRIPHLPGNPRRLVSAPGEGRIFQRGVTLGTYGLSAVLSRIDPERYDDVEVFCAFLGYPRSGSSFIGSMLDAHPHRCFRR